MPDSHSQFVDAGQTLGAFRLLRMLGEGGSGRVFLAERIEFAQRVAIKVLHPEFVRAGLQRPEFEEQFLAALDHAHIVRLLDRATAATGERYLVMEFVDGLPADAWCDAHRLTLRQRLEQLLPALEAVAHAHQRLVLHLDLKPANLLIAEEGGAKLLDFGAGGHAGASLPGDRLTPDFASPEQRLGEPVSVATDVFGLGLLLRLVLAGIPATERRDRRPSDLLKMEAANDTANGSPLPDRLRALGEVRSTSFDGLLRELRGDLDAILLKALAERPEDRYATVQALHDDLSCYLAGVPIAARHTGRLERGWKWVRRHQLAAAAAAVLVLAILLSSAGVAWSAAAAARERRIAELRLHELVRLTGTLDSELYGSVHALPNAAASPEAAEAQQLLTRASATTLDGLAASVDTDAALRYELAGQYEQLARLELAQTGDEATRNAARQLAADHLQRALELLPARDRRRAALGELMRSAVPRR